MGYLRHFDLNMLVERCGLQHFVETGTGSGDGLLVASKTRFATLWSCDLSPNMLEGARNRVRDDRVEFFACSSVEMLAELPRIPSNERILFWLDAHYPALHAESHLFETLDHEVHLPAQHELALIKRHRPLAEDVIIMDDARIWLDADFTHGALPLDLVSRWMPEERNIDFVTSLFGGTHDIIVKHEHEGYIILVPNSLVIEI